MKSLELLAPAKDLECGTAAISHGADAVYIGAGKFSARSAAGNPIQDIERLAEYAHLYRAKVYVALNTILFDHELDEAEHLIRQVWNAGADALIIQDMGILEMDRPPIPLFASTQVDNRSPEHIRFLEHAGFERVILARELSLDTIREIRAATSVDLEAFVHGALCVSYSGRCYLSAQMGGRSANRGECGQPCRLPWELTSEKGERLADNRHLLSLKDMNRADSLNDLVDAGITSFKIEGRLKSMAYVKNITAYYRKRLDAILEERDNYCKASSGTTTFFFNPDPGKTFYRGGTDYFLHGRTNDIHSFDSPKSIGEPAGTVKTIEPRSFTLKNPIEIHNGDGLCYFDLSRNIQGLQVNRAEGNAIFPAGNHNLKKSKLRTGTRIFRNHDHRFLKQLDGKSAERNIGLALTFCETESGFSLTGTDEDETTATTLMDSGKEPAQNRESVRKTLKKQLSKTGDSIFSLTSLEITTDDWFIPTRDLNALRRELLERMTEKRIRSYSVNPPSAPLPALPYPETRLDYSANIANKKAETFYRNHGVTEITPAFEIETPGPDSVVMTTKHCLRYALGFCPETGSTIPDSWKGPLTLQRNRDQFTVTFNCKRCEMILKKR